MKHHFVLSERLAKRVYQILLDGGLVGYDYTDMVSFEIVNLPGLWDMPGWGRVECPIARKFVFECDNPFASGEAQVEVLLMGHENEYGVRDWRLWRVKKVFKHSPIKEIDLPTCSDAALAEINKAKAELKKQEAQKRLFDLTERCPFAAEIEKD